MQYFFITWSLLLVLSAAQDYYEILGVTKTASLKDIKQAFRKLALKYHPDKNLDDPKAEDRFIEIAQAYETLSDPILRLKYDEGTLKPSGGTNQQNSGGKRTFNYDSSEFFNGFNDNVHRTHTGESVHDLHERLRKQHEEAMRRAHATVNQANGFVNSAHENAMRQHREIMERARQTAEQARQHSHVNIQHPTGANCKTTTITIGNTVTTQTVCT